MMNGPFEIEVKIHLTDGERYAVATYDLPVGRVPTREMVEEGVAKSVAAIIGQFGGSWRPLTRHEFENKILSERTGGLVPEFATRQEWDDVG